MTDQTPIRVAEPSTKPVPGKVADIAGHGFNRPHRFDFTQLDVQWDAPAETLWTFMTPSVRPAFSPGMLRDMQGWQREIRRVFGAGGEPLKYVVLGSRLPGVFNLGGDLDYVAGRVAEGDRDALVRYGNACVGVLYENFTSLELPIVTIALIQGDCFGGGWEAALSFDVLVAERGARFALPETMFGSFPGVGAHSFLTRRLNASQAERLMLSGETYSAEEMHALGLVHVLAENGEGEQAVKDYIARNKRRHSGHCGIYRASREVNPVTLGELHRIVEIWADTALRLKPHDVKLMRRLADAQARLFSDRLAAWP